MIRSYKGITALVTGASSGIGKSISRELARQGAHLVLVARNSRKLRQEATDLKARYRVRVWTFDTDLSQKENCENLYRFTQNSQITVDMLVNNAGLGHYGAFTDHSAEDLELMMGLNVEALIHLTRLFLPGMKERRKGGVLNIASTAGYQPLPYLSVYAATKAFVLNFSEALWMECQKYRVRFFCVCPGNTLTNFHQIAGIAKQRIFFSASARDVAHFALKKFLKDSRPTGIFGFWNKLMIYAQRLVPRAFVIFCTNLMYRPSAIPKKSVEAKRKF